MCLKSNTQFDRWLEFLSGEFHTGVMKLDRDTLLLAVSLNYFTPIYNKLCTPEGSL